MCLGMNICRQPGVYETYFRNIPYTGVVYIQVYINHISNVYRQNLNLRLPVRTIESPYLLHVTLNMYEHACISCRIWVYLCNGKHNLLYKGACVSTQIYAPMKYIKTQ